MAIYQGGIKVSGISQIRYYDLGGICNTAANEAAKEIIIDNFVLTDGVTIKALFINANNELNPTITVKDSSGNIKASGIAIKATRAGSKIDLVLHSGKWRGADTYTDEMWQAYTTLELMYDGTDWVIMGNPLFESYVSEDGTSSYSVYADGYIKQWVWSIYSNSQQNATFDVTFSDTNYCFIITCNDTTYSDKGRSFGYNVKTVTSDKLTYQANFANAGGESKNVSQQTKVYAEGV